MFYKWLKNYLQFFAIFWLEMKVAFNLLNLKLDLKFMASFTLQIFQNKLGKILNPLDQFCLCIISSLRVAGEKVLK